MLTYLSLWMGVSLSLRVLVPYTHKQAFLFIKVECLSLQVLSFNVQILCYYFSAMKVKIVYNYKLLVVLVNVDILITEVDERL